MASGGAFTLEVALALDISEFGWRASYAFVGQVEQLAYI